MVLSALLALALPLPPDPALADVKEKVATLAPPGLLLVLDRKGNELVTQNADEPFVTASIEITHRRPRDVVILYAKASGGQR